MLLRLLCNWLLCRFLFSIDCDGHREKMLWHWPTLYYRDSSSVNQINLKNRKYENKIECKKGNLMCQPFYFSSARVAQSSRHLQAFIQSRIFSNSQHTRELFACLFARRITVEKGWFFPPSLLYLVLTYAVRLYYAGMEPCIDGTFVNCLGWGSVVAMLEREQVHICTGQSLVRWYSSTPAREREKW